MAISAGANVKAVQKMLGHASVAVTLDTYAKAWGYRPLVLSVAGLADVTVIDFAEESV